MKTINLLSLIKAQRTLNDSTFKSYLRYFDIEFKKNELQDLGAFVDLISTVYRGLEIYNEYFIGYTIPQISKEFDLLRFGSNYILNIEIKSTNTGERIKTQLVQNKYYLSFLKKKVVNITYVRDENKFYGLKFNNDLLELKVEEIIVLLRDQIILELNNLDKLFDPTNYLVSPFNSTAEFINGNYFLTDQQEEFKKAIITQFNTPDFDFVSIYGAAGTGKTLLTYDIAKEYINSHTKVLIIHCANLNEGQIKLQEDYSWVIKPIKFAFSVPISEFQLIILDEVQRIRPNQLDKLIEIVSENKMKCIFSYDANQCLASFEMKNNIPEYISKKLSPKTYKLTEKIRTNKEIASFIRALFDLNKIKKEIHYQNVDITYFETNSEAVGYLNLLQSNDWKIINYTPSLYNTHPYEQYSVNESQNAHMVIGQEFDKVAAVIDNYFCYDVNNQLTIRGYKPYYHTVKMLFQILTRTRKKLSIVIIGNQELLSCCLQIINTK